MEDMGYLNLGIDLVLFIDTFFEGFFFVVKVLEPKSPAATDSGPMDWEETDTSSSCVGTLRKIWHLLPWSLYEKGNQLLFVRLCCVDWFLPFFRPQKFAHSKQNVNLMRESSLVLVDKKSKTRKAPSILNYDRFELFYELIVAVHSGLAQWRPPAHASQVGWNSLMLFSFRVINTIIKYYY